MLFKMKKQFTMVSDHNTWSMVNGYVDMYNAKHSTIDVNVDGNLFTNRFYTYEDPKKICEHLRLTIGNSVDYNLEFKRNNFVVITKR